MVHPHDIFSPHEPWTVRVVSLAREFRERGHEVKLAYSPLDINETKIKIELDGIELFTLGRKVGLANLLGNIKKIKKASQWADIIHFQKCFHYISIPAIVSAFLMDKPLHYDWDDWEEKIWYHSNRMSIHTLIFGNFLKLLERFIPVLADTVSVSSRKLEEICVSLKAKKGCIFKAPVGADLREFNPSILGKEIKRRYNFKNKRVVLYLGQLHAGQYVKMFIEAANMVLSKYPHAVFLIIGDGYMAGQLKYFARECNRISSVIFTGSIPHDLIPQYIGASDICVASFEDNEVTVCKSPLKIAEYLACGKPIVASLVGEVRNMVGGAGLLVEPGDRWALSEAIITLLENPQLRHQMGLRARRRAETKYNWSETAENLIRAYEKALTSRGMPKEEQTNMRRPIERLASDEKR